MHECILMCECVSFWMCIVSLNNGYSFHLDASVFDFDVWFLYPILSTFIIMWWCWWWYMQCIVCPISANAYWNRHLFMERKLKGKAIPYTIKLLKLTSQHIGMENDEEPFGIEKLTCNSHELVEVKYYLLPLLFTVQRKMRKKEEKRRDRVRAFCFAFIRSCWFIFMVKFLQCANKWWVRFTFKIGLHDVNSLRFHLVEFAAGSFSFIIYDCISNKQFGSHANDTEIWFWCVCVCLCVIHKYCQSMQMQIPQYTAEFRMCQQILNICFLLLCCYFAVAVARWANSD